MIEMKIESTLIDTAKRPWLSHCC